MKEILGDDSTWGGALGGDCYYDGPLRAGGESFEFERQEWLRVVPDRCRNTVENMTEEVFWENGGYDYVATLCCRGRGRDVLRRQKINKEPDCTIGKSRIAVQVTSGRGRKDYISKRVGRVLKNSR